MNRSPDEEYCSAESSPHEEKQGLLAPTSKPLPETPFLFVANDPPKRIAHEKSSSPKKASRKRKWKKPKGMPKRPLSAYNIFFHDERKRIASQNATADVQSTSASRSPIGFAGLAQAVAGKWKTLESSSRAYYEAEAAKEQLRYRLEVDKWTQWKQDKAEDESGMDSSLLVGDSAAQRFDNVLYPQRHISYGRASAFPIHGSIVFSLRPSTLPQPVHSFRSFNSMHEGVSGLNQPTADIHSASTLHVRETELEPNRVYPASTVVHARRHSNAVISSLRQLALELDDDELDFLSSLR